MRIYFAYLPDEEGFSAVSLHPARLWVLSVMLPTVLKPCRAGEYCNQIKLSYKAEQFYV